MLRASPSFATRLLPPLSSTEAGLARDPDLARFLERLAARDRALAVDGLDLIGGAYLEFLRVHLPKLLSSLRSLRSDELSEVGPALSGQPVWGRTVLGWTSGSLPADRFVSRVSISTLSLPENLALRLLLRHLAVLTGELSSLLRERLHPTIAEIGARAGAALRDPTVRLIPDAAGASEQMLQAAEGTSDWAYREAGRLLRRRLLLSKVDDLGRWRRSAYAAAVGGVELTPSDPEEVFELLALSRVLDALEQDLGLGPAKSFWLRIGTGARSGPVAEFNDREGGAVEIYFDRTPSFLLGRRTPYIDVFHGHEGLGQGADRRPDIVVVRHRAGGARAIFFLEVKLPGREQVGRYLRDSVYKAFGYLYDFAGLWEPVQAPKVALYVPSDVGPTWGATADLLVLSPRRQADLPKALAAALGMELKPPSAPAEEPPKPGGSRLLG